MNKKLEEEIKETMLTSLGLEVDDDCLLIKAISGKKLKFNVKNLDLLVHDIANLKLDYEREEIREILEIHIHSEDEVEAIITQIIGDDNND